MRSLRINPKPKLRAKFKNKIVIITGAGRGIGAATAVAFSNAGARIVIVSRTRRDLQKVSRCVAQSVGDEKVLSIVADISSERDVNKIFSKTVRLWGRPDILVNNAAIVLKNELKKTSLRDWQEVLNTNLTGSFLCARAASRVMQRGHIINISSLAGLRGSKKFVGLGSYTASKFGVVGLTEVLAIELAPRIKVNCVAPGAVETRMLKSAAPHLKTRTHPEHIAKFILKMAQKSYSGRVLALHTNL